MKKYLLLIAILFSLAAQGQFSILRAPKYVGTNSLGFIGVSKDSSGYSIVNHLSIADIITLVGSGSGGTTLNGNGFVSMSGATVSYIPTLDTSYFTSFFSKVRASLAVVSYTGVYNDLTGKPTIPTQTSQLTNNSGFLTSIDTSNISNFFLKVRAGLSTVATTGSYNDLLNKPTIPTQTSQLTNNSGFLTSIDSSNISNFFTKVRASLQPIAYSTVPTGITKGNGSILTAAIVADFPTLNQNTTGTSANITGVLNATSMPALTGDITSSSGTVATTLATIKRNSLAANATTTVITNTNTNLSFSIAANEVWVVVFDFTAQCSSTGGSKIQISTPASATIEGWYLSSGAAITTPVYNRITAINTLTTTITHTVATTPGPDRIWIRVKNSTNAGTISLGFASGTATQTTTIFAGATMIAFKVTEL